MFPLNWAPPTPGPEHSKQKLGKSVPTWGEGYALSWHGTTIYGLSASLSTGFLAPSEKEVAGHATAAGRGVYTAKKLCQAARHAVPWVPDLEANHCYKVVILVAIPGSAGKGGLTAWKHDSGPPHGEEVLIGVC